MTKFNVGHLQTQDKYEENENKVADPGILVEPGFLKKWIRSDPNSEFQYEHPDPKFLLDKIFLSIFLVIFFFIMDAFLKA